MEMEDIKLGEVSLTQKSMLSLRCGSEKQQSEHPEERTGKRGAGGCVESKTGLEFLGFRISRDSKTFELNRLIRNTRHRKTGENGHILGLVNMAQ